MQNGDKIIATKDVGHLKIGMEGICTVPFAEGQFGSMRIGISEDCVKVVRESALGVQQGGTHYKDLKIQPIEYIHANSLGYIEGNIVKYITRHKSKNGAEDIKKIIHYCELLLELEYK